jgi:putative Mg2+ transporter-C (MgtC) family protein
VGAALITLVSREMAGTRFDPGRIAAQIVSGIGFLGAGTILRQGNMIRGLTTAASLWVVSGIGMAVATGGRMTWLAVFAALLALFTLAVVNRLEFPRTSRPGRVGLSIEMVADREALGQLLAGLAEQHLSVRQVKILSEETSEGFRVHLDLQTPDAKTIGSLTPWLSSQPGVSRVEWE